jgi:hypothetical protein
MEEGGGKGVWLGLNFICNRYYITNYRMLYICVELVIIVMGFSGNIEINGIFVLKM